MVWDRFRWRLLKQALFQKKAKALLIILAVTMGSSVVTALLNLNSDLRYRMNRELRDYGPNVILKPDAQSKRTYLDDSILSSLNKASFRTQILAYTPELFVPAQAGSERTVLVGTDRNELPKLYPGWKLRTWSTPESKNTALVGVRLAKKLGLEPGNAANLEVNASGQKVSLVILGFIESGEAEDDQIFVDLPTAQRVNHTEGQFQFIVLSVLGDFDTVQKSFNSFAGTQSGVRFQIIRKIAAAETLILEKISRLMAIVITLILVILFFCIHTTVSAILLSRQSEIALFRVLGARRKEIMLELTLELLLLGLLGGFFGYGIGIFMAQVLGRILFQTFIVPRLAIFVITILSSLALMVVSSFLPIRRAINRQAAMVLKEA